MLPEPISEEQILKAYEVFETTLFANIEQHCDIKDHVIETIAALRARGIKIGSTTGYTSAMMERVLKKAEEQGYSPDYCISSDRVVKGRPHPYMIWSNLMHLASQIRGKRKGGGYRCRYSGGRMPTAGRWASSWVRQNWGLHDELAALSERELNERKTIVRATYYQAGADYIIDDMNELWMSDDINRKLDQMRSANCDAGPLTTRHAVKHAMLTDHCTWDDTYKAITTSVMNDITHMAADDAYATVLLQAAAPMR